MQNFNTEALSGNVNAQLDCFGLGELYVKRVYGKDQQWVGATQKNLFFCALR